MSGEERKVCSTCKVWMDKSHFSKDKSNKDGLRSQCKVCTKIRQQTFESQEKRKINEIVYRQKPQTQIKIILKTCKLNDKKNNHECNITEDYITKLWKNNPHCPCGVLLSLKHGSLNMPNPNKFTLDRIDYKLGHILGNVQVLCWTCNDIKRYFAANQLIPFAKAILNGKIKC